MIYPETTTLVRPVVVIWLHISGGRRNMALHEVVHIEAREDWARVRSAAWRYVDHEDVGQGMTRVDFVDDERDAEIAVYCPTRLLPENLLWIN
jgi:hypothetical protein